MRHHDWSSRLYVYLEASDSTPFRYGSFDCLSFAAGAADAITGADIMAPFRGRYTTHLGAMRIAKRVFGVATLPEIVTAMMAAQGWKEVAPSFAQRGDVCLVIQGGDQIAGVIHSNGREAVITTEQGLGRVPLKSVVRAWNVK
jgi:hypothetical protein